MWEKRNTKPIKKEKIKKRDESMGGALWKNFYLNILSKLQYSSKNLFKQLRWIWILSLGKKPDLQSGKNRFAMEKVIRTRRFKENIALRAGWKGWKGFIFRRGRLDLRLLDVSVCIHNLQQCKPLFRNQNLCLYLYCCCIVI